MGGSKAGGLSHLSLSPFPPLPLSIPPKFSDKPVGGKVRSSGGEVPRLPPYKYHPGLVITLIPFDRERLKSASYITRGVGYVSWVSHAHPEGAEPSNHH